MALRLSPPEGYRLLVIGGCGGIGRALVDRALNDGLKVSVFDLPQSNQECPLPLEVMFQAVDATDEVKLTAAMTDLVQSWGGLDGLVNLAGYMGSKVPVSEFSRTDWQAIFSASFDSTLNGCRAVMPFLNASERMPAIVNMSSGLADVSNPGYGPYSAAKAAIVSLTKTLAKENAPRIRVNCVSPGGIDTRFMTGGTGRAEAERRLDPEIYKQLVPLGRLGVAAEVAEPILFLLSEASSYITGQTLHINGGALTP